MAVTHSILVVLGLQLAVRVYGAPQASNVTVGVIPGNSTLPAKSLPQINRTAAAVKQQAEGPGAQWVQNESGKWEWKGKRTTKAPLSNNSSALPVPQAVTSRSANQSGEILKVNVTSSNNSSRVNVAVGGTSVLVASSSFANQSTGHIDPAGFQNVTVAVSNISAVHGAVSVQVTSGNSSVMSGVQSNNSTQSQNSSLTKLSATNSSHGLSHNVSSGPSKGFSELSKMGMGSGIDNSEIIERKLDFNHNVSVAADKHDNGSLLSNSSSTRQPLVGPSVVNVNLTSQPKPINMTLLERSSDVNVGNSVNAIGKFTFEKDSTKMGSNTTTGMNFSINVADAFDSASIKNVSVPLSFAQTSNNSVQTGNSSRRNESLFGDNIVVSKPVIETSRITNGNGTHITNVIVGTRNLTNEELAEFSKPPRFSLNLTANPADSNTSSKSLRPFIDIKNDAQGTHINTGLREENVSSSTAIPQRPFAKIENGSLVLGMKPVEANHSKIQNATQSMDERAEEMMRRYNETAKILQNALGLRRLSQEQRNSLSDPSTIIQQLGAQLTNASELRNLSETYKRNGEEMVVSRVIPENKTIIFEVKSKTKPKPIMLSPPLMAVRPVMAAAPTTTSTTTTTTTTAVGPLGRDDSEPVAPSEPQSISLAQMIGLPGHSPSNPLNVNVNLMKTSVVTGPKGDGNVNGHKGEGRENSRSKVAGSAMALKAAVQEANANKEKGGYDKVSYDVSGLWKAVEDMFTSNVVGPAQDVANTGAGLLSFLPSLPSVSMGSMDTVLAAKKQAEKKHKNSFAG